MQFKGSCALNATLSNLMKSSVSKAHYFSLKINQDVLNSSGTALIVAAWN